MLFAAEPPVSKRLREPRLRSVVSRIWPDAELVEYAGGVGTFAVGGATAVAHFGQVRDGVELLPAEPLGDSAPVAALGDDDETHVPSVTPGSSGRELQLRLC